MKIIFLIAILLHMSCAKNSLKEEHSTAIVEVEYQKTRLVDKEVFDTYHENQNTSKERKEFNWNVLTKKNNFSLWLNSDESLFKKNVGLNSSSTVKTALGSSTVTEHENYYYRHLNEPTTLLSVAGEDYVIQDSLQNFKWNTTYNYSKEILGYNTKMATTTDPTGQDSITAWYTAELPYRHGPHIYWGLNGLILKVEIRKKLNTSMSDLRAIKGSVFEALSINFTDKKIKRIKKEYSQKKSVKKN